MQQVSSDSQPLNLDKSTNESFKDLGSNSLTLCWCTQRDNEICVSTIDNTGPSTIASFQGAQVDNPGGSRQYGNIVPIRGTNHIISTIHDRTRSSNLAILDRSKAMKSIFDLGDREGDLTDIVYNKRRNLAAFLTTPEASFHIFDCTTMNIIKKVKRLNELEKAAVVQGLDFDPEGRVLACADRKSAYYITNIDSGSNACISRDAIMPDWDVKCRWNPVAPITAYTYSGSNIYFVDNEKHTTIKNMTQVSGREGGICGIDWHFEGNLLACACSTKSCVVIDTRQFEPIHIFHGLHSDYLRSVRWSPCGRYLATSSDDLSVKLIDFSTRTELVKLKSPNAKEASNKQLICLIIQIVLPIQ